MATLVCIGQELPTNRNRTELPRQEERSSDLVELADRIVGPPKQARPVPGYPCARRLSNVRYNKTKAVHRDGPQHQPASAVQPLAGQELHADVLVASGGKQLIEQGKTTSIRGLYYLLKHTIEGTKEETFEDQAECDPVIEDMRSRCSTPPRRAAPLCARTRRHGRATSCWSIAATRSIARMGSGGYGIPSIVEPEVIQFQKCKAKFILHVEKDTVWQRFNEDKFWRKHKCILTHGGGQPPRGVRRLLHRLHNELNLPVYCLLDNDPWGYYIYSVIKQGSINLAYESKRMAIPDARFLGLRSMDFERCGLSDSVKIDAQRHRPQAGQADRRYPWFAHKKPWQKEIQRCSGQRLQAGSRSADQQGHQLRDRGYCAVAIGGRRLAGLDDRCNDWDAFHAIAPCAQQLSTVAARSCPRECRPCGACFLLAADAPRRFLTTAARGRCWASTCRARSERLMSSAAALLAGAGVEHGKTVQRAALDIKRANRKRGRASRPAMITIRPRGLSSGTARSKFGSRNVSHHTLTPGGANSLIRASTSSAL